MDEEFQVISVNSVQNSTSISCGICSKPLDGLTLPEREEHYEHHFVGGQQQSTSSLSDTPGESSHKAGHHKSSQLFGKVKRKWIESKEIDVFWYPSQATSPPSNYTPGIIPLLKNHLWKCHTEGITCRAALCYKGSVHINRELWDASWGCGYRNFLMACAALMDQTLQPLYFPLLDAPVGPGVRNLQTWLEAAWQAGFDSEGAKELKNLVGTSKWIGTSDIWTAFSSRGIPAELVDFNLKNQPQGVQILTDWVVEHFSPKTKGSTIHDALRHASPINVTDRMPLILQDNLHSRTIVGYEVSRDGTVNLLIFDPAFKPSRSLRDLALSSATCSSHTLGEGNNPKRIRRFWHLDGQNGGAGPPLDDISGQVVKPGGTQSISCLSRQHFTQLRLNPKMLRKQKYQILYFPMSAPLTDREKIQRRVVTSTKIC